MKYRLGMEKLVYLLWPTSPEDTSGDTFRDQLLAKLPAAVHEAGGQRLKISVTDSAVAAGESLHLGAESPKALATFWLECVRERRPIESALTRLSARTVGYLVVESQPLRFPDNDPAPTLAAGGKRTTGFSLVGCIEPADGVSQQTFVETWETKHAQVAIDTQSTFSYVRNEVVRPLTSDAPPWRGIVEEGFPVEALTDSRAFYDAGGDEAVFRANQKAMVDSCAAFLSLTRVDSHPMSEYRFF